MNVVMGMIGNNQMLTNLAFKKGEKLQFIHNIKKSKLIGS